MQHEQLAIDLSETSRSSPDSSTEEETDNTEHPPIPLYIQTDHPKHGKILLPQYPHWATHLPHAHLNLVIQKKDLKGDAFNRRMTIESFILGAIHQQKQIEHKHGDHHLTLVDNKKWVQWRFINLFGKAITAKGTYSIKYS